MKNFIAPLLLCIVFSLFFSAYAIAAYYPNNPNGSATSANSAPVVIASDQGAISVSQSGAWTNACTQSGSWTVTANAGTNLNTNGLALDTSVSGVLLTQGSATSGQKGPLMQGAVTTNAPSYTTAQTSPISLDPSGLTRISLKDTPANTNKFLVTPDSVALPANQSVNVNQLAGTATDTNSGTKSAGTLRVVIATDQPQLTNKLLVTPDALPANQSVNMAQIGGTAVTADPCLVNSKSQAAISQTANTKVIAGTAAKKTYVCSVFVLCSDAENISFLEGTQVTTVCDTGPAAVIGSTTAANGMNMAANEGFTMGAGFGTVAHTATNANDLCLFQSGAGRCSGVITYVQQ